MAKGARGTPRQLEQSARIFGDSAAPVVELFELGAYCGANCRTVQILPTGGRG